MKNKKLEGYVHKTWNDEDEYFGLYFDEKDPVDESLKKEVAKKFFSLEHEVEKFIIKKSDEFESYLKVKGLRSGMGTIGIFDGKYYK